MDENISLVMESISDSKGFIIASIIVFIIFIILLIRSSKKRSKRRQENLHNELLEYSKIFEPKVTYSYSGNITVTHNGVIYSRGNRSVLLDIKINPTETEISLKDVEPWFENRNYNEREAMLILNDIKEYLTSNGIATVKIKSRSQAVTEELPC